MVENLPGSQSMALLQKSLDALWLRQKVITDNIANNDTPGYKSKSVAFEEVLKKTVGSGNVNEKELEDKLQSLEPKVLESKGSSMREDGNNVDIDAENIELARSEIQYEFLTRMASSQISRLKYVITEGKG